MTSCEEFAKLTTPAGEKSLRQHTTEVRRQPASRTRISRNSARFHDFAEELSSALVQFRRTSFFFTNYRTSDVARKKTPKVRLNIKASLAKRLREVRQELFGEHGGPELSRRLGLPARTWYNYESGVTVPAEILLGFIDQTGTNPDWLLNGNGPKYLKLVGERTFEDLTPADLIRRGLEMLERSPRDVVIVAPSDLPSEAISDYAAIRLVPIEDLAKNGVERVEGHVLAYREWLPNVERTVAVRLVDDAMSPILPTGSIIAIDRTPTDLEDLHGRIAALRIEDRVVVRWVEVSARHLIARSNGSSRQYPPLALELDPATKSPIIGQVVWSWSKFADN